MKNFLILIALCITPVLAGTVLAAPALHGIEKFGRQIYSETTSSQTGHTCLTCRLHDFYQKLTTDE